MLVEINLLPSELRRKAKADRKRFSIQVPRYVPYIVCGAILFAAVISFAVMTYTGSVRSNLLRARKMLREEKKRAAQAITLSTQLPELEERAASLVERVSGKIHWWEILEQIMRCCPSNAVLQSIKVEYETGSEQPTTLFLSGFYENSTGLEITFTKNLQSSAKLAKYIDRIYPGQTTIVAEKTLFTVKCNFRQPERKAETGEKE